MNIIEQKFKSGNNTEVDRITLTRVEWEMFKRTHVITPVLPVDEELDKTLDRIFKKQKKEFAAIPLIAKPGDMGCLWDQLSAEERMKPQMLSCPCPKCSPMC